MRAAVFKLALSRGEVAEELAEAATCGGRGAGGSHLAISWQPVTPQSSSTHARHLTHARRVGGSQAARLPHGVYTSVFSGLFDL